MSHVIPLSFATTLIFSKCNEGPDADAEEVPEEVVQPVVDEPAVIEEPAVEEEDLVEPISVAASSMYFSENDNW